MDINIENLSESELEELILEKMEELREASHPDVSDNRLRCAAKFALKINKVDE